MEMCYVVKVNFSILCLPVTQLLCPGVFIVTNFLCILPEVSVHSQTFVYILNTYARILYTLAIYLFPHNIPHYFQISAYERERERDTLFLHLLLGHC